MISKHRNIFNKSYTKNCSREIFVTDSVLNTNPWTYKTKDSKGDEIIGCFHEKELLLTKL